jgi:hypothetical protein
MTQPPLIFYLDYRELSDAGQSFLPLLPSNAPEGSLAILGPNAARGTQTTVVNEVEITRFEFSAATGGSAAAGLYGTTINVPLQNPQGDFIYINIDHPTNGIRQRFSIEGIQTLHRAWATKDPNYWPVGRWATIHAGSTANPARGSALETILNELTVAFAPGIIVNALFIDKPTQIRVVSEGAAYPGAFPYVLRVMSHAPHSTYTEAAIHSPASAYRMTSGTWTKIAVDPLGTGPLSDLNRGWLTRSGVDAPNFFVHTGTSWVPARDSLWYMDPTAPTTTAYRP